MTGKSVFGALMVGAVATGACSGGPSLRMQGNEASAIQTLRSVVVGQVMYASRCGSEGFASSLGQLATPAPDGTRWLEAEFSGPASDTSHGYRFKFLPDAESQPGPADCNGKPTVTAYVVTAEPVDAGQGSRAFAMDASSTMWEQPGVKAPTKPFGAPAKPVQ